MKKSIISAGIVLSCLLGSAQSIACTDFRLTAEDGSVFITRSMEFATDLKSTIMTSPRGRLITSPAPNGKPGISWKAKYGYIYLDGFNTGYPLDGINEQGLSFEALYLPGETQYPVVPAGQENKALAYFHFGDWLLGNFRTIDEVKQALPTVNVFAQAVPQAGNTIFPLHFSIYDSSGKGIVVEFIAGKMMIHDNVIGILTNSPTYDWQVTNLRNYVNLTPMTPKPIIDAGLTFVATGQGAGMKGLPGDISPPSRFVKMTIMTKSVFTPRNANEALNTSQHIINNVDIPFGFVRTGQDINKASSEFTQWVVLKDLTHKILYFRTYSDSSLRFVDLSKVNLSEGAPQFKMSLPYQQIVIDMSQQLSGKMANGTKPANQN